MLTAVTESHHYRLFGTRRTATTSFPGPGPVWNSARGRFLLPPPCMEPPANRTQADAFHAGSKAFLENVLVPDCLLRDRTVKLHSVMRHCSSCRRRTESTVDYDYDYEHWTYTVWLRKSVFTTRTVNKTKTSKKAHTQFFYNVKLYILAYLLTCLYWNLRIWNHGLHRLCNAWFSALRFRSSYSRISVLVSKVLQKYVRITFIRKNSVAYVKNNVFRFREFAVAVDPFI